MTTKKSLVIVESPAKAKTINRYLGDGFIVKSSAGHVKDLPLKKLGVDVTVSTTNMILESIEQEVPTHALTHLFTLRERGLELVDIRITPGTPTAGRKIKDLPVPKECQIALIIDREGQPRLPEPESDIRTGDQIIALTTPEQEQALRAALRGA